MSKRILVLLVLIAAAITFTDVGKSYTYSLLTSVVTNQAVPAIAPEELDALPPPYVLLDVRTPEEYKVSHLKGARLVNHHSFRLSELKDIPKDKTVIVYCTVGFRSSKAGIKLQEAGYTDVRNLEGGMINWVNKGYPVFNAEGRTNRIHPYSGFWGFWLTNGEKVYEP